MTREEIGFIKETLVEAIDWAEYADDYFKQKHNLKQDQDSVAKCIKLLDELESMTCKNCKVEKCKIYYALVGVCTNQELINFGCNKFEKKDKQ